MKALRALQLALALALVSLPACKLVAPAVPVAQKVIRGALQVLDALQSERASDILKRARDFLETGDLDACCLELQRYLAEKGYDREVEAVLALVDSQRK